MHGFTKMALAASLMAATAAQAVSPRVNDTGLTTCRDRVTGKVVAECADSRQDAAYGRDVTHDNRKDGRHGFSFTKIAADGTALPAKATQWACVRDEVTGRLWEVKTATGLHATATRYTNLDSGGFNDASGLAAATNAEALCGKTDWRLPTREELVGLTDYSVLVKDAIDTKYFPDVSGGGANRDHYWSSTQSAAGANHWTVGRQLSTGITYEWPDNHLNAVQLVSFTLKPPLSPRFVVVEDGVLDRVNKLIWQRCAQGQTWDGASCVGEPATRKWVQALDIADQVAAQTGKDWRLPNVKELLSLTEGETVSPQVDSVAFPNFVPIGTWSSTLRAKALNQWADDAFVVLGDGRTSAIYVRQYPFAIRLVRDAK